MRSPFEESFYNGEVTKSDQHLQRIKLTFLLFTGLLAGCSGKAILPSSPAENETPVTVISTIIAPAPGPETFFSLDLGSSHSTLISANAVLWLPDERFAVAAPEDVALVDVSTVQNTTQNLPVLQAVQPANEARF